MISSSNSSSGTPTSNRDLVLSVVEQLDQYPDHVLVDVNTILTSAQLTVLNMTADRKTNVIDLLIQQIDDTIIETERIKKRNIKAIYCLVSNVFEFDKLRIPILEALRTQKERIFLRNLEIHDRKYGKLNRTAEQKTRRKQYTSKCSSKWQHYRNDYMAYLSRISPQIEPEVLDVVVSPPKQLQADDNNNNYINHVKSDDQAVSDLTKSMENSMNIDSVQLTTNRQSQRESKPSQFFSPELFSTNKKRKSGQSFQPNLNFPGAVEYIKRTKLSNEEKNTIAELLGIYKVIFSVFAKDKFSKKK